MISLKHIKIKLKFSFNILSSLVYIHMHTTMAVMWHDFDLRDC